MAWIKPVAIVLLLLALMGGGYAAGSHFTRVGYEAKLSAQRAADATALAKAEAAARAKEQLAADTLVHIQAQNEQDKADAQAQYEKDVADLRAGVIRLRKQWQCPADPGVSGTSSGTGKPDAAADQRAADAAALVRIARDADDQIRALQDIVKADRNQK